MKNTTNLKVPEETIKETIRLAKRYIKDRRLPDAAIDLADRSMAALRLINDTGGRDLEAFKNEFDNWDKDDAGATSAYNGRISVAAYANEK